MYFRLEIYERVLKIIGCRSKLEVVEKMYPLRVNDKTKKVVYGRFDSSIGDALNEMLTSSRERFANDPYIKLFRLRLSKDYPLTVPVFMSFSRWLYKEFSDKTCHKMAQFLPALPEFTDKDGIRNMLQCVQIDPNVPAVECIQLMLQPLDFPS